MHSEKDPQAEAQHYSFVKSPTLNDLKKPAAEKKPCRCVSCQCGKQPLTDIEAVDAPSVTANL